MIQRVWSFQSSDLFTKKKKKLSKREVPVIATDLFHLVQWYPLRCIWIPFLCWNSCCYWFLLSLKMFMQVSGCVSACSRMIDSRIFAGAHVASIGNWFPFNLNICGSAWKPSFAWVRHGITTIYTLSSAPNWCSKFNWYLQCKYLFPSSLTTKPASHKLLESWVSGGMQASIHASGSMQHIAVWKSPFLSCPEHRL